MSNDLTVMISDDESSMAFNKGSEFNMEVNGSWNRVLDSVVKSLTKDI
jgi:hypothetical protein